MANPGLLRLLKSENRVSILFITSLSNNVWVFSELFVRQLIRIIEINMYSSNFIDICVISLLVANVFVYGKLRVCGRGFSEGKSEAGKRATTFDLAKTSNFLYTVLPTGFLFG